MQAVIEVKGKQYRVSPEQTLYVDLTGEEVGKEISIDKVLLVHNGSDIKVGQPYVANAVVKAQVVEEAKGPKVEGYFYRRKNNQHRRWGHRQKYHQLKIVSISA